jgi:hypothetical protein
MSSPCAHLSRMAAAFPRPSYDCVRIVWTWQRWIGVSRLKVRRIARSCLQAQVAVQVCMDAASHSANAMAFGPRDMERLLRSGAPRSRRPRKPLPASNSGRYGTGAASACCKVSLASGSNRYPLRRFSNVTRATFST